MKIAILSRDEHLYSCSRLAKVARGRGYEVDVLDPTFCAMSITDFGFALSYKGVEVPEYTGVVPRIGTVLKNYGLVVLRHLEMMSVVSLNSASAIERSRDKISSIQLLASNGIPFPKSAFANHPDNTDLIIDLVNGAPLIVKLAEGSQGVGVVLSESKGSAISAVQAFFGLHANFLVQEFIAEAEASDIRCFVIGGKVVASIKRQGPADEFRSNLHRGGIASRIEITDQESDLVLKVAKLMGLDVCGIDLLRSRRGPLVMEVNASPGFEGVERATGVDIASLMIDQLERLVKS